MAECYQPWSRRPCSSSRAKLELELQSASLRLLAASREHYSCCAAGSFLIHFLVSADSASVCCEKSGSRLVSQLSQSATGKKCHGQGLTRFKAEMDLCSWESVILVMQMEIRTIYFFTSGFFGFQPCDEKSRESKNLISEPRFWSEKVHLEFCKQTSKPQYLGSFLVKLYVFLGLFFL